MKSKSDNKDEQSQTHVPLYTLLAILVLATIGGITSRTVSSEKTTLAGGDALWNLTITASVVNVPNKTNIKIHPPLDTRNISTIQRNISYPGFRIRKLDDEEKYQRSISLVGITKGKQTISTNYLLHVKHKPANLIATSNELPTEGRERYLLDTDQLQYKSYTVNKVLEKILKKQPNQEQLVHSIYRYSKSIPIYHGADSSTVPRIINRNKATVYDRTLVMVSLSRAGGLPARLVSGLILKDDIDPLPHYWAEIYNNGQWLAYDVFYGYKKTLPHNYLPIRKNYKDVIDVSNGVLTQLDYELEQEYDHPYIQKDQVNDVSSILNLTRLPINTREELAFLLLLPLGALITVFFRHVVGVHSFGVFTPTLLALAIVYANMMTTAVVFLVVILLAVWGRSMFPSSLNQVPRLSIIFTLIAIILTFSVSVLNFYDIDQGGKIILLPIIILTSLVDRLYRTIDERGIKIAMHRLSWTIVVTLVCLPVMRFETLGNLILEYPEIHFTTLAIILWISSYTGDKLIKLPVLKVFAEPKSKSKKIKEKEELEI